MVVEQRQPLEMFYSYAHEDELLRKELEKHLHTVELQGLIKGWHAHNISAGIEWAHEIDTHLNSAHIILLLVSPDFLSSRYCYSMEMKRAMERHYAKDAYVIPIILRPIYWQGAPFSKLQVLPTDAKPVISWSSLDDAFLNITIGIHKAIERFTLLCWGTSVKREGNTISRQADTPSHSDIPFCPYRGLFAFQERDSPFFFGRDVFAEQLIELVRKKSFVAVIGPSGCGKSSLVFAGLLPRLRYEGIWQIATFRPSESPFHALAWALVSLLEPEIDEIDHLIHANKLTEPLQKGDISLYDVVEHILQKQGEKHILLFVDQFEELYTLCQKKEDRQQFLECLVPSFHLTSEIQHVNFTLVITLRADFLSQVLLYRPLVDLLQSADVKVSPMNPQELQEAIVGPAELLGVQVQSGLANRIVDAIYQVPENLPLLEFTLTTLWAMQENSTLTHSAYEKIGGVEYALASYAEKVYIGLDEREQQQVRKVFMQLIHSNDGTEDTRRIATFEQVGGENWDIVIYLSKKRLVVCGRDEATGEETVELVHEALIKVWKNLREWMKETREFRMWQEQLRTMMRKWEKNKKDDGAFLRGTMLFDALKWMQLHPDLLSSAERVFIEECYQHQLQEQEHLQAIYEKLKQSEDIEKYQNYFLSSISHELRTPITAICGYSELLSKHYDDMPIDMHRDFLQQIMRACDDLTIQLTNVFDALSLKSSVSTTNVISEHLSVHSVIEEVIKLFNNFPEEKKREILVDIKEPLFVIANLSYLQEILYQITWNAFIYSFPNTLIIIRAYERMNEIIIDLVDHGQGVPLEDQVRLFERFFRLPRDLAGMQRGLGLGLYISRRLVESMNGSIEIVSSGIPGEGSTFTIKLPLSERK